jgi:hypothetical protein
MVRRKLVIPETQTATRTPWKSLRVAALKPINQPYGLKKGNICYEYNP